MDWLVESEGLKPLSNEIHSGDWVFSSLNLYRLTLDCLRMNAIETSLLLLRSVICITE